MAERSGRARLCYCRTDRCTFLVLQLAPRRRRPTPAARV